MIVVREDYDAAVKVANKGLYITTWCVVDLAAEQVATAVK